MMAANEFPLLQFDSRFCKMVERSLGEFEDIESFQQFMREDVRPILPYGKCYAALWRTSYDRFEVKFSAHINHCESYLRSKNTVTKLEDRPSMFKWLKNKQPILISGDRDYSPVANIEREEMEKYSLGNIALHGQVDISGNMASYFSLVNVPKLTKEYAKLFEVVTPYLHIALLKTAMSCKASNEERVLTEKEKEVFRWLALGKSNKEISLILNKSGNTIKNQVHSILKKMGAANRTEAISRADMVL